MKISQIAAVGKNRVIGKEDGLVWKLPDDFKRFKAITSHHYILMGRKTFDTLGNPLPNRTHVVITRKNDYQVPEGHHVFHSIEEGIDFCKKEGVKHLFVIGGGEIYQQTLALSDELLLTQVEASPDGDAHYPEFDRSEFKVTFEEYHGADEKNEYAFTFVNYERI